MSHQPNLEPGRVYRTRELGQWSTNSQRLAKRLVRDGMLVPLVHGLYLCPKRGRFGVVPPSDRELMRAFLDGAPFVFTGPERWNALGLGTTAVFAVSLVYNTKRSGLFDFGGRRFLLRRVEFPAEPLPEWFVIDLFEHAAQAGKSQQELAEALVRVLRESRGEVDRQGFDAALLLDMARRYGSRQTQKLVTEAVKMAST